LWPPWVVRAQRTGVEAVRQRCVQIRDSHTSEGAMSAESRSVVHRLDARERAVLLAIYEHKVLLTKHLKAMFFGSLRRAQDRLRRLTQLGLIETWYPTQPRGTGKAPGHHTLTGDGAGVVLSLLGLSRTELRWVERAAEDRDNDAYLAHRIGVNEFFCALLEAGRRVEGCGLLKWVPERTVKTADGWIRPDGFGTFLHPHGALDFYLEYDRGTETTRQLANKLAGYIGVARDWTERGAEYFPCVLIVVPSQRRERLVAAAFLDALARFNRPAKLAGLSFYVSNEETLGRLGVLDRVWAPLPELDRRLTILDLRSSEGVDYDLSECIGRYFTEDGAQRWARLMPLSRRPHFGVGEPPGGQEGASDQGVVA
jgi:hypothetical protein